MKHGAEGRLRSWRPVGEGEGDVVDPVEDIGLEREGVLLGEEEVGDAGHHGHGPAQGGDDGGPAEVGEGEDVEGPADGEVALQGEGHDGQHAGVGGALRQEGAQAAEQLPEQVRVLVPEDRQLVRQAWEGNTV